MTPDSWRRFSSFLLVATLGVAPALQAQLPECRPFLEGPRLPMPDADPALRTGAGARSDECTPNGGFGMTPASVTLSYRSSYPFDRDGRCQVDRQGVRHSPDRGGPVRGRPSSHGSRPSHLVPTEPCFRARRERGLQLPLPNTGLASATRPGILLDALARSERDRAGSGGCGGGFFDGKPVVGAGPPVPDPAEQHRARVSPRAAGHGTGRWTSASRSWTWTFSGEGWTSRGSSMRSWTTTTWLFTGVFLGAATGLRTRSFRLGIAGVQHNRWDQARRLFVNLFTFPFNEEESTEGNGLLSSSSSLAVDRKRGRVLRRMGSRGLLG